MFIKLTENLSNRCIIGDNLKKGSSAKASNVFLVDKIVWKRLLSPHICADAAFRLLAISMLNRSRPQQGIHPPPPFTIRYFGLSLLVFQKTTVW